MIEKTTVCLTGLPGSGKHRIKQILLEQVGLKSEQVFIDSELSETERVDQLWCVIDIRPTFKGLQDQDVETYLKALIENSSGVIFNFSEAADLDSQSFWSRWVRQQCTDMPIVRVLNQRFPDGWSGFDSSKLSRPAHFKKADFVKSSLKTFEFEVGTVYLDHLLLGLDSSKQNLGMKIWRVQAVIDTFEYDNLVAVEGSANRWDTYAAGANQKSGWIKVQGIDLESAWLEEIIQASLLMP